MKLSSRRWLALRVVLDAMRTYAKARRQFRCQPFENVFVAGDRGHAMGLIRMGFLMDAFSEAERKRMDARMERIGKAAISRERRPRLARAA